MSTNIGGIGNALTSSVHSIINRVSRALSLSVENDADELLAKIRDGREQSAKHCYMQTCTHSR